MTDFSADFVRQVRFLAEHGCDDDEMAAFFQISGGTLIEWRVQNEDFQQAGVLHQDWYERRKQKRDLRRAPVRKYRKDRFAQSPAARIENAMRARLWAALKGRTDNALFSRLPYTAAQLCAHLERCFQPGMSLDNYGCWHVDHRRPCASFDQSDPEQFAACWALENLQPLWAQDNLRKSAALP